MPAYKDEHTGTWFVKCYYTDYMGNKKQKKKRGFSRQKNAEKMKFWTVEEFKQFLDNVSDNPVSRAGFPTLY